MSRRYDSRTTTFSPEGRLFQVEYAMEAISHAGTSLGIVATDGIVFLAEKKITSKLLEPTYEKIYPISDEIIVCVSGITSDANILITQARSAAQKHALTFQENLPVEQLVQNICNMKQSYTQFGGMRPFGVSFLWAGYDDNYGWQMYVSDPSGNYAGWKATCLGEGSGAAQSILKSEYAETMDLKTATDLIFKILAKTSEATSLSSDKLEAAYLEFGKDGRIVHRIMSNEQINSYVETAKAALAKENEDKMIH